MSRGVNEGKEPAILIGGESAFLAKGTIRCKGLGTGMTLSCPGLAGRSVWRERRASRRREGNAVRASFVVIAILPSFPCYFLKGFSVDSFVTSLLFLEGLLSSLLLFLVAVCLGSVLGFLISLPAIRMALIRPLPNGRHGPECRVGLLAGSL